MSEAKLSKKSMFSNPFVALSKEEYLELIKNNKQSDKKLTSILENFEATRIFYKFNNELSLICPYNEAREFLDLALKKSEKDSPRKSHRKSDKDSSDTNKYILEKFSKWKNRIKIPVRGAECDHCEVMDLEIDFNSVLDGICVICGKHIDPLKVYVESRILGLLSMEQVRMIGLPNKSNLESAKGFTIEDIVSLLYSVLKGGITDMKLKCNS